MTQQIKRKKNQNKRPETKAKQSKPKSSHVFPVQRKLAMKSLRCPKSVSLVCSLVWCKRWAPVSCAGYLPVRCMAPHGSQANSAVDQKARCKQVVDSVARSLLAVGLKTLKAEELRSSPRYFFLQKPFSQQSSTCMFSSYHKDEGFFRHVS